jgi:hypothetical protein
MQINGFVAAASVWTGEDQQVTNPSAKSSVPLLRVLALIVFAECALLVAATVFLVVELLVATPTSYASAIALTVLVAIGAIWVGVIAVNLLRRQPWTRGATVVWQILQIAVAVGMFQGAYARPDLGWLLLIPSIVVLVLLFTPSVRDATVRR